MERMQQLEKLDGFGNVQMVEVDRPQPAADQMLIRVRRSLISRGSELFRRYVLEEAVSPDIMGYSDAGEIVDVGTDIEGFSAGQQVMVSGPHAQFVLGHETGPRKPVFALPDGLDHETATFLPLTTSSIMWMRTTPIDPGQTVVILGQGIVGALCAQVVRERSPGCVITVDAQPLRCEISRKLGADHVIDVSETDSVAAVMEITNGKGADVVVECVGGQVGIRSFEQAQDMVAAGGVIHLISKYQGAPLPLDGDRFMNKQLIAGIRTQQPRHECLVDAARMLVDGSVRVAELITHRLPWEQTPDAYHMLYKDPGSALGVVLMWE
ncbi:MAG: zinc-binding dehydrogenase [Candidatus Latescibacterota bacterium]|jgi:threonine dehydrogenase-like Zn-dependent dehydrogenase